MIKRIICVVCAVFILSMSMPLANATESKIVFSKNPKQTKKIAITFDDGPHPRYTEKILDILNRYDIKATFFVIGVNIENYPEAFRKIYENGHEIANHSYSHASEKDACMEFAINEIEKCEQIIYNNIGIKPKLFRPPQGIFSSEIEKAASKKDYSIILWSIDTKDWAHNSPQNIMKSINDNIRGGDIILMHDYISGKNTTCDALEIIIPNLLKKGYEFVTVSELISEF